MSSSDVIGLVESPEENKQPDTTQNVDRRTDNNGRLLSSPLHSSPPVSSRPLPSLPLPSRPLASRPLPSLPVLAPQQQSYNNGQAQNAQGQGTLWLRLAQLQAELADSQRRNAALEGELQRTSVIGEGAKAPDRGDGRPEGKAEGKAGGPAGRLLLGAVDRAQAEGAEMKTEPSPVNRKLNMDDAATASETINWTHLGVREPANAMTGPQLEEASVIMGHPPSSSIYNELRARPVDQLSAPAVMPALFGDNAMPEPDPLRDVPSYQLGRADYSRQDTLLLSTVPETEVTHIISKMERPTRSRGDESSQWVHESNAARIAAVKQALNDGVRQHRGRSPRKAVGVPAIASPSLHHVNKSKLKQLGQALRTHEEQVHSRGERPAMDRPSSVGFPDGERTRHWDETGLHQAAEGNVPSAQRAMKRRNSLDMDEQQFELSPKPRIRATRGSSQSPRGSHYPSHELQTVDPQGTLPARRPLDPMLQSHRRNDVTLTEPWRSLRPASQGMLPARSPQCPSTHKDAKPAPKLNSMHVSALPRSPEPVVLNSASVPHAEYSALRLRRRSFHAVDPAASPPGHGLTDDRGILGIISQYKELQSLYDHYYRLQARRILCGNMAYSTEHLLARDGSAEKWRPAFATLPTEDFSTLHNATAALARGRANNALAHLHATAELHYDEDTLYARRELQRIAAGMTDTVASQLRRIEADVYGGQLTPSVRPLAGAALSRVQGDLSEGLHQLYSLQREL